MPRRRHVPHEVVVNHALIVALAVDPRKEYVIAANAGVRADALSGYKYGRLVASPEQKQRIADVLGKPVEEIFPASESIWA